MKRRGPVFARRRRLGRSPAVALAYWLAVIVVACLLVFLLLLVLERRDEGSVSSSFGRHATGQGDPQDPRGGGSTRAKRAKTTIRLAAL